jgi:hypothetical protein
MLHLEGERRNINLNDLFRIYCDYCSLFDNPAIKAYSLKSDTKIQLKYNYKSHRELFNQYIEIQVNDEFAIYTGDDDYDDELVIAFGGKISETTYLFMIKLWLDGIYISYHNAIISNELKEAHGVLCSYSLSSPSIIPDVHSLITEINMCVDGKYTINHSSICVSANMYYVLSDLPYKFPNDIKNIPIIYINDYRDSINNIDNIDCALLMLDINDSIDIKLLHRTNHPLYHGYFASLGDIIEFSNFDLVSIVKGYYNAITMPRLKSAQ